MSGTFFYIHTPKCRPLGPRESVPFLSILNTFLYHKQGGSGGCQKREEGRALAPKRCAARDEWVMASGTTRSGNQLLSRIRTCNVSNTKLLQLHAFLNASDPPDSEEDTLETNLTHDAARCSAPKLRSPVALLGYWRLWAVLLLSLRMSIYNIYNNIYNY